jgi:hypothetical protein
MDNKNTILYIFLLIFVIIFIYTKSNQLNQFIRNIRKYEGFINDSEIPKIVFQTWKTVDMPPLMKKNRDRMMKLNPEFEYIFMDDEECRNFIRDNYDYRTLSAYDKLVPGAYKADMWRYCVLYKHGGIYLDIKLRPADDFKLIYLLDKRHYVQDRLEYFKPGTLGLYNACIIEQKGSECMKQCIEKIVEHVETNYYGYNDLYPTGPGLLGTIYTSLYKDNSHVDLLYVGNENILQDGKLIIHSYPEYREEAPSTGSYGKLWRAKNIYK